MPPSSTLDTSDLQQLHDAVMARAVEVDWPPDVPVPSLSKGPSSPTASDSQSPVIAPSAAALPRFGIRAALAGRSPFWFAFWLLFVGGTELIIILMMKLLRSTSATAAFFWLVLLVWSALATGATLRCQAKKRKAAVVGRLVALAWLGGVGAMSARVLDIGYLPVLSPLVDFVFLVIKANGQLIFAR